MKNSMLLLALFLCVGASARETTVEFNLTGVTFVRKNRELPLKMVNVNKKLKKKGLDGLPSWLAVNKNAIAYWKILMKRVEDANKAGIYKSELLFTIDHGYFYQYPPMCYRGKIEEVVPVIDGMMKDNFLTSEQGIFAIRWGSQTDIRDDSFKSEKAINEYFDGMNEEEIAEWVNFDKRSKNVLVMSNLGPQGDGTDLYATTIKPCR
ncbi:MAG: hypothetical protein HYR96_02980 [Deltaproteobacteria bacterium]|nr:hypothetical protein [Deltaproteobacteria bacterium]MBI3294063.1 hypothetical protein [Deltaproteobacteria bacterium]